MKSRTHSYLICKGWKWPSRNEPCVFIKKGGAGVDSIGVQLNCWRPRIIINIIPVWIKPWSDSSPQGLLCYDLLVTLSVVACPTTDMGSPSNECSNSTIYFLGEVGWDKAWTSWGCVFNVKHLHIAGGLTAKGGATHCHQLDSIGAAKHKNWQGNNLKDAHDEMCSWYLTKLIRALQFKAKRSCILVHVMCR